MVPCGHAWCIAAAAVVAAGCHCLGLQAPDEPDLLREWYTFTVGRVAVGVNVSGGVGHVPLDPAIAGGSVVVHDVSMRPAVILNVVAVNVGREGIAAETEYRGLVRIGVVPVLFLL